MVPYRYLVVNFCEVTMYYIWSANTSAAYFSTYIIEENDPAVTVEFIESFMSQRGKVIATADYLMIHDKNFPKTLEQITSIYLLYATLQQMKRSKKGKISLLKKYPEVLRRLIVAHSTQHLGPNYKIDFNSYNRKEMIEDYVNTLGKTANYFMDIFGYNPLQKPGTVDRWGDVAP